MKSVIIDVSMCHLRAGFAAALILSAVNTGTAYAQGAPPREGRLAGGVLPASPAEPEHAVEPDPTRVPGSRAPSETRFQWRAAVTQTLFFTSIQTLGRLPNQSTRANLGGPFVNDWMESAAGLFDHNWNDGNKIATNYIAHPAGGAVYANIARQNSKCRALLPGDRDYAKGVMMAMAFAAAASLNHEIGPMSEASIGNIGMHNPDQQGWIDPVITPTLGAAWMVMEDLVYKRVLSKIEGRKARVFWAVVLNPSRSAAGAMAGRMPGAAR